MHGWWLAVAGGVWLTVAVLLAPLVGSWLGGGGGHPQ